MTRMRPLFAAMLLAAPLLSAGAVGITTSSAEAAGASSRTMWAWHLDDPAGLVATAQKDHVDRILAWVSPGFSKDTAEMAKVRDLVNRGHQAGVHIDALGGDPSWAKSPNIAGTWAAEVAASGLFERLHLDAEPDALPDWSTNQTTDARGLVQALTAASAAGQAMPVDADIAAWFWQVPEAPGVTLDQAVLGKVSSITIMSYQRTAQGITASAAPEVAAAAKAGRVAHIGINLAAPGADGPSTSLYGLPLTQVSGIVGQVETTGKTLPGYAGVALHDAAALAALPGAIAAPAASSTSPSPAPPRITLQGPARALWGDHLTLTGRVVDPVTGHPRAGLVVTLLRRLPGAAAQPIGTARTDSRGDYALSVMATQTATYTATAAGGHSGTLTPVVATPITATVTPMSGHRIHIRARAAARRQPLPTYLQVAGPGGTWHTVTRLRVSAAGTIDSLVRLQAGRRTIRIIQIAAGAVTSNSRPVSIAVR